MARNETGGAESGGDEVVAPKSRGRKNFPGGGGNGKKTRPKNSTIKPPSTLSVPCIKIQGGGPWPPLLPAADAHEPNLNPNTKTFSGK